MSVNTSSGEPRRVVAQGGSDLERSRRRERAAEVRFGERGGQVEGTLARKGLLKFRVLGK